MHRLQHETYSYMGNTPRLSVLKVIPCFETWKRDNSCNIRKLKRACFQQSLPWVWYAEKLPSFTKKLSITVIFMILLMLFYIGRIIICHRHVASTSKLLNLLPVMIFVYRVQDYISCWPWSYTTVHKKWYLISIRYTISSNTWFFLSKADHVLLQWITTSDIDVQIYHQVSQ